MPSSLLSTENAPAQRVPAWKRLGLKLKPASEDQSQNATLPHTSTVAPPVPNHHQENPTEPVNNANPKRKSSGVPASDHSAKKARRDVSQNQIASTQTPKKAKSVSFAAESTQEAGPSPIADGTPTANKKKAAPAKKKAIPAPVAATPLKKQAPVNLEPALTYLRQWHTSRDSWKFNKNHQTRLLEQVFADETTIPAADIHVFYEYIRALKGAVRTRLKELASGTRAQDMEQGSAAFSASKKKKEMAQKKQGEYEEVIARFLAQPMTPGKRRFDEVDYVLRTSDMEMQRRVVKRMRCEMVLDELSNSEETEIASSATAATSSTEKGSSIDSENVTSEGVTSEAEGVQRLRLNDGPQQRAKRKRKVRTAVVDEDSSSESDSDSDSENQSDSDSGSGASNSSSSSSSDDSDDEVAQPHLRVHEVDSSSSSSSSSSESFDADSGSKEEDD
ncbi:hypothetical protein GGR54DRAFT_592814 [Hypoxylon sp. NC1633]|nr:hypothetical protein GGR54DRAFT_592814 [Hypoxylon sp. NC1633]